MNSTVKTQAEATSKITTGKKILFASVPADGHVNPLTGLAVYLKNIGHDVRWYTSSQYADKISKLQIPHYPFVKALDVRGDNLEEVFPQRKDHKSQVAKLNFDIINVFTLRSVEYYADIVDIHRSFPFDCMIADCAFSAISFVKEKLNIPVIGVGILPLTETSKDLAPVGLGMVPSYSFFGRMKQSALRWMADHILFKKSNTVLADICAKHRISYNGGNVFDFNVKKSTLFLQSATPGFEYQRRDLGKNIKFIGPLLPHTPASTTSWFDEKLNQYEKVVLVTQGTVEKDVEKLLVPTLEAFKESNVLVVATTGGSNTDALKKRFPEHNFIIESFIPFADVMPYADVYITNGGYGGVLLGIENELPLVVAGIHEGKNEINARIGYFHLGVNLKTETPQPYQIRKAVQKVLTDQTYKQHVTKLSKEFKYYHPQELCAAYINEMLEISNQ
jgi:MGT family glycosyltransferase